MLVAQVGMNTTRIGVSTPRGFNPFSWLVLKLTKSTASHAFFVYYDEDWDTDMVMDAHEEGFRILPLTQFEKKNVIVATFHPVVSIEVGVKFVALTFLGTPFDFGGLFGTAFVLLGRWLKRKWHNPLQSARSVFCSEAAVVALQKSGYPGAEKLVPQDTTPQDLLQFFQGTP